MGDKFLIHSAQTWELSSVPRCLWGKQLHPESDTQMSILTLDVNQASWHCTDNQTMVTGLPVGNSHLSSGLYNQNNPSQAQLWRQHQLHRIRFSIKCRYPRLINFQFKWMKGRWKLQFQFSCYGHMTLHWQQPFPLKGPPQTRLAVDRDKPLPSYFPLKFSLRLWYFGLFWARNKIQISCPIRL